MQLWKIQALFYMQRHRKRTTALYMVGGYYSSRFFHRMSYQCSQEHRSTFYLLNKSRNLQNKSEWYKKTGHLRKAMKYFWKAIYLERLGWINIDKKIKRYERKFEGNI